MIFCSWHTKNKRNYPKTYTEKRNTDAAADVPFELDYEYEMWFWFDPFISNKKCAVCITSKMNCQNDRHFPDKKFELKENLEGL